MILSRRIKGNENFQKIRKWRWKTKKKTMKNFQTCLKYFNLYFSEALKYADFKYVFRFFISFYDQKLQSSKVGQNGQKRAKTDKMDPLWRAVTFDRSKTWKIQIHIWNQVKSFRGKINVLALLFQVKVIHRIINWPGSWI